MNPHPRPCRRCGCCVVPDGCWSRGSFFRDPNPDERAWIEAVMPVWWCLDHPYSTVGVPGLEHVCDPPLELAKRPLSIWNLAVCRVCQHSVVRWHDLPYDVDPAWWQRRCLWSVMTARHRHDHPFAFCGQWIAVPHECPPQEDGPRHEIASLRESFGPRWSPWRN